MDYIIWSIYGSYNNDSNNTNATTTSRYFISEQKSGNLKNRPFSGPTKLKTGQCTTHTGWTIPTNSTREKLQSGVQLPGGHLVRISHGVLIKQKS